jgi:hypothetical protein
VRDEADRSTVILRGDGLFDPAATVVKPRYVQVIHRVAAALDEVPGKVIVNGYTDNLPIRTARPSNWNLSQERAQAVSQAGRLAARPPAPACRGPCRQRPRRPNNTAEGRALNRRVEIVLLVRPSSVTSNCRPCLHPRPGTDPMIRRIASWLFNRYMLELLGLVALGLLIWFVGPLVFIQPYQPLGSPTVRWW